MITVLGVRGDVVRGPNEGAWTTSRPRWVPMSDWLGTALTPADHDEARAVVLTRWLRTFGPATVNDVKWWFGNTLTWARDGLRDVNAVEVDIDGSPGYVLPDDLEPEPDVKNWCALLPGLDVTIMGWQDRDWYLGEHRSQVFDRNGNAGPTVWFQRSRGRRLAPDAGWPRGLGHARRRKLSRHEGVGPQGRSADRMVRRGRGSIHGFRRRCRRPGGP